MRNNFLTAKTWRMRRSSASGRSIPGGEDHQREKPYEEQRRAENRENWLVVVCECVLRDRQLNEDPTIFEVGFVVVRVLSSKKM